MGGSGSGRYGGRPTTQDGLTLDIDRLRRHGLLRNGCGSLIWTSTITGDRIGDINYEIHLGGAWSRMRLQYTSNRYGENPRSLDYPIELVTTPQPFGGRRWWFLCPRTGAQVSKLHMPAGATFASRRAHCLGYRSQRQAPYDRAINQAFKLRRRLGDEGGIGDPIAKARWMRWRTFEQKMARIEAVEAIVDMRLAGLAAHILGG
jgi:hypothetical protein